MNKIIVNNRLPTATKFVMEATWKTKYRWKIILN